MEKSTEELDNADRTYTNILPGHKTYNYDNMLLSTLILDTVMSTQMARPGAIPLSRRITNRDKGRQIPYLSVEDEDTRCLAIYDEFIFFPRQYSCRS